MFAKVLTVAVASVLTLMAVRMMAVRAEKAKVRVRKRASGKRPVELVEDPETGVYRPKD
jgi:hypothetical protein